MQGQHAPNNSRVTGFTGSPGEPLISTKPILGPLEPPLVIYRNEKQQLGISVMYCGLILRRMCEMWQRPKSGNAAVTSLQVLLYFLVIIGK